MMLESTKRTPITKSLQVQVFRRDGWMPLVRASGNLCSSAEVFAGIRTLEWIDRADCLSRQELDEAQRSATR
ncbi:MAG TPA: hypothetical protein VMF91_00065 [Bryobacteraceae bacterium]|nr:hypothetical protein [Bryobacteraceae bacterium]